MTHDRERLLGFARSYTAAWNSGDPAQVVEHYEPGAMIVVNGGDPTPMLAVAESFMADFPAMELELGKVAFRDDGVVEYHWTLRGEHAGTRNRVDISGFEEWTIGADGRVAASRGHFDASEYARQVAHGVG